MADNVARALNPKNSLTEVMDIYSGWASTYNGDVGKQGFYGPKVIAHAMQSAVTDKGARILDIGAGTGRLGTCLKEAGYTNIDALDANEAMLDEARKLNVYKHFILDFLAKNKLEVENDTYDAVTGSGVFFPGHMNEDCFDELCRITKPGGKIILICSDRCLEDNYNGYGLRFAAAIQEYQSRGFWTIEKQESVMYDGPYKATFSYLLAQ